jgi:hypothetical protein
MAIFLSSEIKRGKLANLQSNVVSDIGEEAFD